MPNVQRRWVRTAALSEPSPRRGRPEGRVGWGLVLGWSVGLAVAIALLRWLGDGQLAAPVVTDLAGWRQWLTAVEPAVVVAAMLRLGALGLAWYLVGVTSISVLARVLHAVRLARLAIAISSGPVRVLVQQVVGVGLATSVLAAVTPAGPPAAGVTGRVVMVAVAEDPQQEPRAHTPPGRDEPDPRASVATSTTSPDLVDDTTVVRTPPVPVLRPMEDVGAPTSTEAQSTADPAGPPDGLRERRVEPGDHFWAIAAEEVAGRLGRSGTEAEVRAHWVALLAANADRLVVRGNPDLLLPGQRILLPDVDGARP